ncbi:Sodium/hydrogen exchanger 9B2 [Physocladia obscura]|uniref:Sodium/hydrogen exchanger 9B2 n=1 Tax=Physocladia obscura TaxID=109957 RepID=A0AAD5STV0_9FUNG|nr:Sodium/hydrogen exchanger 9B2 [Physocladia obscura]
MAPNDVGNNIANPPNNNKVNNANININANNDINANSDANKNHEVKQEHHHNIDEIAEADAHRTSAELLVSLVIVVSLGALGGRVAERLRQPPMLGMLLTGLFLRNMFRAIIHPIPHAWTTPLWTLALSAVTARAGLSLQTQVMNANLSATLLLGIFPVVIEACFLSALINLIFHMTLPWCFTLSFGVASVSPGVVVPLLLNLMDRPHWKSSRVPPVLLAATGLDVLIATTGFGVSLAAIFGHAHELDTSSAMRVGVAAVPVEEHSSWLARAVEELFFGFGSGIAVGLFAYFLARRRNHHQPQQQQSQQQQSQQQQHRGRFFVEYDVLSIGAIFMISTAAMMVLKSFGFPGAASSCVIVCWAIVANVWEKDLVDSANKRLKLVWNFAEPFLFPLIGASVCLIEIRPIILILSLLCVFISICVRMAASFIAAQMAGMSIDEQIFTSGLWAGKASVQAALSTTTIELVYKFKLLNTEADENSRIVFACMVSAIMLGGPFAAAWVSVFGNQHNSSLAANDHVDRINEKD